MYLRRMAAVLLSVRQKPNSPGAVSDTVGIHLVTMCNSCSDQSVGSKKEAAEVTGFSIRYLGWAQDQGHQEKARAGA